MGRGMGVGGGGSSCIHTLMLTDYGYILASVYGCKN